MAGLVNLIVQGLIYAFASFVAGALAGFLTRKILKLAVVGFGIISFVFAADVSGFIETGVDWIGTFDSFLRGIGAVDFATGVAKYYIGAIQRVTTPGSDPAPVSVNVTDPSVILVFVVLILPFAFGFLKAMNPK